ncbi:UV radiation resistance-associated gene protein isoform X1 [Cloeon dipterum]|uniref:UV radiation resistance-associated gene protein isoform X1 n=1 Tax=Cloeon dipterum TaxID=197152 RepID=UPI00321FB83B
MAVRWQKEWIPLVSQQMRVRNLTQILAYNLHAEPSPERAIFFYTLHLTSKSAPFYTSDQSTGPNPRWIEIDFKGKAGLSSTSFVIRIWQVGSPNRLVTTWGVCLSGLQLAPLDQDLSKVSSSRNLVFFIHGFRFVPPSKEQVLMRLASAAVGTNDAKLSYPVNQLRRLKTYQMQQMRASTTCESLRQEIQRIGPFPPSACPMVAAGNKHQYQKVEQLCESVRMRLKLLKEEKARREVKIQELRKTADSLAAATELRSALLDKKYESLQESTALKDSKTLLLQTKEATTLTWSQLMKRRQELISQLKYIYPISIDPEGLAKICGVKLLRSDELNNQDEASSSVALGFAAHATVMVAKFLDVPLRYPIQPAGSRAKIWDVVASKLPDSERDSLFRFPLFLKGRDSIQFYYAVYLLNKNIAQLKFYTGFTIRDLRTTLHNLRELLYMKPAIPSYMKNSHSSSSIETVISGPSQNSTTAEEERPPPVTKSRLAVEEPVKSASSLDSVDACFLEPPSVKPVEKEPAVSGSLDKGLDYIKEATKSTVVSLQYKSANNSDPNLREKRSPQVVSSTEIPSDSAPVKLRTQSECVDPNGDVPKENLPTYNSLDNLFVSVASRTEALASKSGSFNLVKSRPIDKS